MDATRSAAELDREVMAMLLATNAQLVRDVLASDEDAFAQVMRAIAATRSLDLIVEDTLRALVGQARAAGHTWAEIGAVLHVTRQAAFQRFGNGREAAVGDGRAIVPVDGAVVLAVEVLQAFLDSDFEATRSAFGARMLDACSAELLADVREKARVQGGEVRALGTPVLSVRGGYTGVDIPIVLERAELIGRVVLDSDRRVAGFFVRRAEDLG